MKSPLTRCKQRADALPRCYKPPFDELMGLGFRAKHLMDFIGNDKGELALKELEEIRGVLDKVEAKIKEYMSKEDVDMLEEKKRQIDEYLSTKDPADYGAKRIGPVGPPGAHVIGRTYETTNLIVIELDEHGLRLRDGYTSEDVSDKSVAEIIETIEDWAQTLREETEEVTS